MGTKAANILLVYPPSQTQSHTSCPAGIMMIGAVLEKAGHKVRLLDANAQHKRRTTADILEVVRETRPDLVGVTLITPMVREAYRLTSGLKELGVKLLAGGPHATLLPEEALKHGFDAAIFGEGEPNVAAAVEALLDGHPKDQIRGWVYRDADGNLKRTMPQPPTQNLDELPFPARHLVDPAEFGPTYGGDLFGNIFSSRGCPARCAYCAGGLFGKAFRFRSAENVVAEIEHIHKQHGTTRFHFTDDTMAQDRQRVKEICRLLLDAGLKITWSMMTRIDSVDEEILALASKAGCNQIDYGVESGHPETLKKIHKPHTIDMVRKAVPMTARAGIKPYVFFILGFPWETPESVDATLGLMVELSPYVDEFFPAIASILIPFPGTEIYKKYKDEFDLHEWWLGDKRNYDAPAPETHSYFETNVFPMGAVLDADFFRYSPEMKRKIFSVFRYMYLHNLRKCEVSSRIMRKLMLDLSLNLYSMSPRLERSVFGVMRSARSTVIGGNGQKLLAAACVAEAATT